MLEGEKNWTYALFVMAAARCQSLLLSCSVSADLVILVILDVISRLSEW